MLVNFCENLEKESYKSENIMAQKELIWLDTAVSFCNFSFSGLQDQLIRQGALNALKIISNSSFTDTKRQTASCIRCLASHPHHRAIMVEEVSYF